MMNLGTCMGIYWTVKFALIPLGFQFSAYLIVAYSVLTLAVPFIGYRYAKIYRDKACEGYLGFGGACIFLLGMYLFASMFASVAHYIYFAFIDNGFLVASMNAILKAAAEIEAPSATDMDALNQSMDLISSMNATDITLQCLSSDIFMCSLISVPTALLVARYPKKVQDSEEPANSENN